MNEQPTLSVTINITATGNLENAEACAEAVLTATRVLRPLTPVLEPAKGPVALAATSHAG